MRFVSQGDAANQDEVPFFFFSAPLYLGSPGEPHRADQEGIGEEEALNKHLLHKQALKRFIRPEEVAACAVYLASDLAASVTGETIGVSGGW